MKKEKAITLIALVITIIILLILAGVTIATLTGEDGLLRKAINARNATNESQAREKVELLLSEYRILKETDNKQLIDFLEEKKTSEEIDNYEMPSGDETVWTVQVNGYKYKITSDLAIEGERTSIGNSGTGGNSGNGEYEFNSEVEELLSNINCDITVEDVLTSEKILDKILSNNNNIDYIFNNKEKYGKYIINNTISMKKFASNSYAMNKMIENSDWTNDILNSEIAISALDESNPIIVPTMTSNNSPSGEAFASSEYRDSSAYYPAWYAFSSIKSYWCVGAYSSYKNQYVAYDFGEEKNVWVYKIVANVTDGKQNTYYVIEGSNDKTNWDTLTDQIYQGSEKTIIPNNYNKKYRYYRLKFLSENKHSGTGNTVVYDLQFYGK